jgi:Fe2+ or Zn2+ uptake regulation protein
MKRLRKITVAVPEDLLQKAQQATGTGIADTVRSGLKLLAAEGVYARIRAMRGKVRFSRTTAELKEE